MPIKRYKAEQIVTMLRQIEVGIANGKTTPTSADAQQYYSNAKEEWWVIDFEENAITKSKRRATVNSVLQGRL